MTTLWIIIVVGLCLGGVLDELNHLTRDEMSVAWIVLYISLAAGILTYHMVR